MGRSTKLTPEIQQKIADAVRAGNHFSVACEAAGISAMTGHEWKSRGEGLDPDRPKTAEYALFAEAIKKAQAEAETKYVGVILKASTDTWTAAAWWLERKYPERWGRTVQDVNVRGKVGVAQITADELAQSDRELDDWQRSTDDSAQDDTPTDG